MAIEQEQDKYTGKLTFLTAVLIGVATFFGDYGTPRRTAPKLEIAEEVPASVREYIVDNNFAQAHNHVDEMVDGLVAVVNELADMPNARKDEQFAFDGREVAGIEYKFDGVTVTRMYRPAQIDRMTMVDDPVHEHCIAVQYRNRFGMNSVRLYVETTDDTTNLYRKIIVETNLSTERGQVESRFSLNSQMITSVATRTEDEIEIRSVVPLEMHYRDKDGNWHVPDVTFPHAKYVSAGVLDKVAAAKLHDSFDSVYNR